LRVEDLSVAFREARGWVRRVSGVSLRVERGEAVALVGASGSGKSVTARALLRLHRAGQCRYPSGQVMFQGIDLLALEERLLRCYRGGRVGLVFQDAGAALNPVWPVGAQVAEAARLHKGLSRRGSRVLARETLARVGLDDLAHSFDAYPHQLSGGQRQRALIALAVVAGPRLLVADEPTAALDAHLRLQILALLDELRRDLSMGLLLITHDLPLVRRFADRVAVMDQGRIVEQGPTATVFEGPRHPCTRSLLGSELPQRPAGAVAVVPASPVLEMRGVSYRYPPRGRLRWPLRGAGLEALRQVSLRLYAGTTVAVVGESGAGKSTLAKCVLRLLRGQGEVWLQGQRLDPLRGRRLRERRRLIQAVFQDPYQSLSPHMKAGRLVEEGLRIHRPEWPLAMRRQRVTDLLQEVGLEPEVLGAYPHELSGGQRQRLAIARALITEPRVLVLDEPTSALDARVQRQVLDLLERLLRERGLAYLFISHDLRLVQCIADEVLVMRHGRVVESGPVASILSRPAHEYTRTLMMAAGLPLSAPEPETE
jgi:microcin C transport system ATP-binding protein